MSEFGPRSEVSDTDEGTGTPPTNTPDQVPQSPSEYIGQEGRFAIQGFGPTVVAVPPQVTNAAITGFYAQEGPATDIETVPGQTFRPLPDESSPNIAKPPYTQGRPAYGGLSQRGMSAMQGTTPTETP